MEKARTNRKFKDSVRSKLLGGYEIFVYLVKEYAKKMPRDAAIREVRDMILRDLTLKEHIAVSYEDGVEDGRETALEKVFDL